MILYQWNQHLIPMIKQQKTNDFWKLILSPSYQSLNKQDQAGSCNISDM